MACPLSWGKASGVPVADREAPVVQADPVGSGAVVAVAAVRAVLVAAEVADHSNSTAVTRQQRCITRAGAKPRLFVSLRDIRTVMIWL
jgi:hypothetical protein